MKAFEHTVSSLQYVASVLEVLPIYKNCTRIGKKEGYIIYYSLASISFVLQNNASEEVKTMIMIDHPNLLSAYCSFTEGEALWIVMPYMAGGSCYHLMKSSYPKGFDDENFIA